MVVFICQFTKSLRFVFPSSLLRLQLQSRLQGRPNLFLTDDGDDDYSSNEDGDDNDGDDGDGDDDDGGDIGDDDATAGAPPSFSLPPIE